jgi:hypothetical protein
VRWVQASAAEFEVLMRREDRRATAFAMVVLGLAVLLPLVLSANSDVWHNTLFFNCGLLAHEVGHRVAMHRHRQRRPWLFFATLFGARHPVHAPGASRAEIFWLHAMPSLSGVLLGGLLLVLAPAIYPLPELLWFALGLVVFSFLSLLPLPLADGGRILDLVFLPRQPLLSCRIQIGALVLVTLVTVLVVMVIAGLVAVPLVMASVHAHRVARARAHRLTTGCVTIDPAGALRAVDEAGFGRLSFRRRCRMAAELLSDPTSPPLMPASTVVLAIVYLGTLVAGAALFGCAG